MIKTLVIWLVKFFKLEEVFIAEFKALVKARLNAKLASLENVVHSIENSHGIIGELEGKAEGFLSHLVGGSTDLLKKEFNVIESGVKQVRQELKDEIEKL